MSGARLLKLERVLFGDQDDRRSAGRDFCGMCQGLLRAWRSSTLLKRLHRGEMDFRNPVERRIALRRLQDPSGYDLCFSLQLRNGHRDVLVLIHVFECRDIFRGRVSDDEFCGGHAYSFRSVKKRSWYMLLS